MLPREQIHLSVPPSIHTTHTLWANYNWCCAGHLGRSDGQSQNQSQLPRSLQSVGETDVSWINTKINVLFHVISAMKNKYIVVWKHIIKKVIFKSRSEEQIGVNQAKSACKEHSRHKGAKKLKDKYFQRASLCIYIFGYAIKLDCVLEFFFLFEKWRFWYWLPIMINSNCPIINEKLSKAFEF